MEEHLEHYATTFVEQDSTATAEQNLFKNKKIETSQTN